MKRQITLDTETTGLSQSRDRVIEIGAVEFVNREPTGRFFHVYIHPGDDVRIHGGAAEVHGITIEFLEGMPQFKDIAEEFLAFICGAELIMHNAPFDVGFLDAELKRLGLGQLKDRCDLTDTLVIAKQLYQGKRNNLNALCERLGVEVENRKIHGALIDAEILGAVYLRMTQGQDGLGLNDANEPRAMTYDLSAPRPLVQVSEEELEAHVARMKQLTKRA